MKWVVPFTRIVYDIVPQNVIAFYPQNKKDLANIGKY